MDNTENNWAEKIIHTAKESTAIQPIDNDNPEELLFAVPEGMKVEKLPRLRDLPNRIKGSLKVVEVKSFIDYWQKFSSDKSVILANLEQEEFRAVFDYHEPDKPAWLDHTCILKCQTSTEWRTWFRKNKSMFSQVDFAEFIEANAIDIINPSAADMIEVAMTLQANKKVKFNSGVRLDNGQIQLGYHEVIEGSAGAKGQLKIPDKFSLALRIFQGGDKYDVECHLRYRINDGDLRFFYQIIRPERLLEDAFNLVKEQVEKGCSGAAIFATA